MNMSKEDYYDDWDDEEYDETDPEHFEREYFEMVMERDD